jgi:hypothetical protein
MSIKEDYIYAAGLFDGEGSIMLLREHRGQFRIPAVSMTSTTKDLLVFMKDVFGGSIRQHKSYKDHHKPSWIWTVRYNRALDCARKLLLYSKEPVKVQRLKLLVNEYKKVTPRNGKYFGESIAMKLDFESRFLSII